MEKRVTTWGAALTLTRLCVGSGLLALPYATTRGGLLFSPLGLIFIAVWNGIACLQLIACRDRTAGVVVPTSITNSYAKIAFCGLGWIGVGITDASVFITLFGVCVSTLVNCAALLQDIFGDHLSLNSYIALTAVCTYPLTCLKNMSMLARLSPLGIVCLALNVATIVGYGVSLYWNELTGIEVPMWPQNPPALASYTGIAIFCFGVCTMVLQVEESMEDAATFPSALLRCLVIVCAVYFFVGDIVALLYSHDSRGVFGNILLNLPRDAVISTLSRLAMIASCVLYLPLAFLPPANICERLLMNVGRKISKSMNRGSARAHDDLLGDTHHHVSYSAINAVEMRTISSSNVLRELVDTVATSHGDLGETAHDLLHGTPLANTEDNFYVRSRRLSYDANDDHELTPCSSLRRVGSSGGGGGGGYRERVDSVHSCASINMNNDPSSMRSTAVYGSHEGSSYQRHSSAAFDSHDSVNGLLSLNKSHESEESSQDAKDLDTSALVSDEVTFFIEPPYWFMVVCRAVLLLAATVVAMKVPCFNALITLLGCLTVSVLSFILPPWIHMRLITEPALKKELKAQEQRRQQQQQLNQSEQHDMLSARTTRTRSLSHSSADGYYTEPPPPLLNNNSVGVIEEVVADDVDMSDIVIALENQTPAANVLSSVTVSVTVFGGWNGSARSRYVMDVCLLWAGVAMCLASTYVSVADIYDKLKVGKC